MKPQFSLGDIVLVMNKQLLFIKKGDAVVVQDPRTGRPILKRVEVIKNKKYFVTGDNMQESTDSRTFGWISESFVIGKVIYKISK
jgi:type IV secretory pathway protease TraF